MSTQVEDNAVQQRQVALATSYAQMLQQTRALQASCLELRAARMPDGPARTVLMCQAAQLRGDSAA